jgi:hypothetical protein
MTSFKELGANRRDARKRRSPSRSGRASSNLGSRLPRTLLPVTSEVMRPRFLNKDEFAQVVRNTPLVAIDLIIRDPDRCVLVGLGTNEPAKG